MHNSLRHIAVDRWNLCLASSRSAIHSQTSSSSQSSSSSSQSSSSQSSSSQSSSSSQFSSHILLSHETGMSYRPIHIYFQNLFCHLLHVTIISPFNDEDFQYALYSTQYARRYVGHDVVMD